VSDRPGGHVAGLHTTESGPSDGALILMIHGSMDRGAGLARLARRLDGDHRVVRYDRRGYGRSRPHTGPYRLADHVDDAVAVLDGRRATVFGHSYGGDVALAVAAARPAHVTAVAVYEPPLSWLDWWPTTTAGSSALAGGGDPADAAERFMRRLIGDERWDALPAATRAARRAEGPVMLEELADLRRRPAWAAGSVRQPCLAMCGAEGASHHRRAVDELGSLVPGSTVVQIPGARHAGPLTHADAVAAHLRELVGSGAVSPVRPAP
jgi:pimeloyl-ACP methyl ester carboxylesterase